MAFKEDDAETGKYEGRFETKGKKKERKMKGRKKKSRKR
jgi:hypothetical protein